MVIKVDLDLCDGGHADASGAYMPGDLVPDDKELSRGGYAVANYNDTNGNGTSDNVDHPCSPDSSNRGYAEYDTMKLVINKPDPVLPGVNDLIFQATNGLAIWQTPNKVPFLNNPPTGNADQGWYWDIPLSSLPLTAYIEAPRNSQALKDMYITAKYAFVTDTIPITGIWVDSTSVTSDFHTKDELKQLYEDMDQSILDNMAIGTGVWPTDPNYNYGTMNGIVFQFTVMPPRGTNDGTWEADNIFFDVTRRIDGYGYWKYTSNSDWMLDPRYNSPWPYMVETANDDPQADVDSSKAVTPLGHLYSADTPQISPLNPNGWVGGENLMNAREFVRVEIDAGQRVSGNGWKYSRGSDYVPWHSEIWCIPDVLDPDVWARRTTDNMHNEIGTGADINNGYPL